MIKRTFIISLFAVLFSGSPAFAHQNEDVSYIYEESSKDAERCFEQVKSGSSFLETGDCVEMQKRAGSFARHYFCHKTGDAASCRNHPADRGTTSSRSNNPGAVKTEQEELTAQIIAKREEEEEKKNSGKLIPILILALIFSSLLWFTRRMYRRGELSIKELSNKNTNTQNCDGNEIFNFAETFGDTNTQNCDENKTVDFAEMRLGENANTKNLTKCEDCQGYISRKAKTCPHCGCPIVNPVGKN